MMSIAVEPLLSATSCDSVDGNFSEILYRQIGNKGFGYNNDRVHTYTVFIDALSIYLGCVMC